MYMVYICAKSYTLNYQDLLLTTIKPKERKKEKNTLQGCHIATSYYNK